MHWLCLYSSREAYAEMRLSRNGWIWRQIRDNVSHSCVFRQLGCMLCHRIVLFSLHRHMAGRGID